MRLVLGGAAFAGRPFPEFCRIARACGCSAVELWLGGASARLADAGTLADWLRVCMEEGVGVAGAAGVMDPAELPALWGADDLARRRHVLELERVLHRLAELGAHWCVLEAPVGRMLPPGEEAVATARFARELARLAEIARGLHLRLVLAAPGEEAEADVVDELVAIAHALEPAEVAVAIRPRAHLTLPAGVDLQLRLRPLPAAELVRLHERMLRAHVPDGPVLDLPAGEPVPELAAARLAGALEALDLVRAERVEGS